MTKIEREKLQSEWAARIADYQSSGLTMAAWCAANQCIVHQLKYWLTKSKAASSAIKPASSHFVSLKVSAQRNSFDSVPPLVARIGNVSIELHSGFDPVLLREAVHALAELYPHE